MLVVSSRLQRQVGLPALVTEAASAAAPDKIAVPFLPLNVHFAPRACRPSVVFCQPLEHSVTILFIAELCAAATRVPRHHALDARIGLAQRTGHTRSIRRPVRVPCSQKIERH